MLHGSFPDLVCLSHLRWNFVFQRPQHLMVRFARERRVFFVEEPLFDTDEARLDVSLRQVHVVTPHLTPDDTANPTRTMQRMLDKLFEHWRIDTPALWLYTPLAWPLVAHVPASVVVYDCMDDLTGFAGASPHLGAYERHLMAHAHVMFTGGQSLYEAKRALHPNVHPVPSSVDISHFARARAVRYQPADQRDVPHPRVGFCGVIDERMDRDLLGAVAAARPDYQFMLIGPVAKIDESSLPRAANIHYLGMKPYTDLPAYFAGWDVAVMPFAHNAATRYISPTKTPEYLAAGCPVVSTSIRDVVCPYGERQMVFVADSAADFAAAIDTALGPEGQAAVARAEELLATLSWDRTWAGMNRLVCSAEAQQADLDVDGEVAVAHTAQP